MPALGRALAEQYTPHSETKGQGITVGEAMPPGGASGRQPGAAEGRLPASGQEETGLPPSSIPIRALRWLCRSFPVIRTFRVTDSLSLPGREAGSLTK